MTDHTDWQKPVVFYDGGCPLCRREIMHYRRIDGDRQLCWVDIHAHPETLQACGLTLAEAMQRMHIMESDGSMVREYVYVKDVVEGYLLLAESIKKVKGE